MTVLSSCLLLVLCKCSGRIQGVGSAAVLAMGNSSSVA